MERYAALVFRRAVPADYKGILQLQEANLRVNLSEADVADGFLTLRYTEDQFREINRHPGIAVALRGDEVVGYLCAKNFAYAAGFPIVQALIEAAACHEVNGIRVSAETAFVYGPVCIARSVRGQGVLAGLWKAMRNIVTPEYSLCVLFIADANQRSMRAHLKLGMGQCGEFTYDGKIFHVLAAPVA
jgi:hypothetical protein